MEKTFDTECIFCQIVKGESPCVKVWENENYIAIENKFPEAPVDILVMPKWHIEKSETRLTPENFWNEFMSAIWEVTKLKEFDKTGYVLQNNGAGYNHLEHEHIHIMCGMPKP